MTAKAAGFDPEQVNFVVNSHFHFDHVGGNKYLTGATTLVNTAELRHAKVPEPFEHLGYSDLSFDFPGTKYERISGDIEIADGLWLYETPGHTAGHYSLLVEMDDQPSMIFAGDAGAFDFVVSLQAIPRRGVPDDIAPAVAFLASEEAHWIIGQMLTADGGHTRH